MNRIYMWRLFTYGILFFINLFMFITIINFKSILSPGEFFISLWLIAGTGLYLCDRFQDGMEKWN